MTPDKIKSFAKQAGADYDTDESDPMSLAMFYPGELAEFTRLVRQQAFDEAATQCQKLADCDENTECYRHGAAWCESRIRGLK